VTSREKLESSELPCDARPSRSAPSSGKEGAKMARSAGSAFITCRHAKLPTHRRNELTQATWKLCNAAYIYFHREKKGVSGIILCTL